MVVYALIFMMFCLTIVGICQLINFVKFDGEIRQSDFWMLYVCAWIYLIGWFIA